MQDETPQHTPGAASPVHSEDVRGILEGPALPAILRLAGPAAASMLMHTLLSITDIFWVSRLGAAEAAAVNSATYYVWIIYCLNDIMTVGVVALISRSIGAGDYSRASHVARTAIQFAVFYALTLMVIGSLGARAGIGIMEVAADVQRMSTTYLQVFFLGAIPLALSELFSAFFRASGNTRIPLWTSIIAIGLNIVLDPLLIYGWGPFPQWGVAGAAAATVLATLIAVTTYSIFIAKNKLGFVFKATLWSKPDWRVIGRFCLIGLPISLSGIVFASIYVVVNRITATFGTEAVAALGIGNRMESINYMISFGCSMAVATMVGQNLGAKQPKRAAELTYKTIALVTAFTGATSAVFILSPEAISGVFTNDPVVASHLRQYLIILAVSQVFMGWEIVLEGGFSGAGNTLPPMLIYIPGAILRWPMAHLLAIKWDWGVKGIWWTISLTTIIKGIIFLVWFRTGRWQRSQAAEVSIEKPSAGS